jgi:hypothetical protein
LLFDYLIAIFATKYNQLMKPIKLLLILPLSVFPTFCQSKQNPETFGKGEFKSWTQTPPKGWNSWDCYGPAVKENEVKANAGYMAEKLKEIE